MSVPVPPRIVRRLLIDPLWVPLALILAAVVGVICVIAGLLAPITPRRRVLRVAWLALRYVLLDLSLMLGSFGLWLASPWPGRDEQRWQRAHCALLNWALTSLMGAARRTFGYEVVLENPFTEIRGRSPLLVLARHAGPGDSFTLVQVLMGTQGRRPRVVLKAALQWDPGLDVVLNRLSGCFLPSRTGAGDDRIERIADLARGLDPEDALLLFPEGGNWTPRRQRRAVAALWRSGRRRAARQAEQRPRVLPPRPGGTLACLAACPDADVLLVAHTGLDRLVTPKQMWAALPLRDQPMRVHWWLHPAATVPREKEAAEAWLQERWTDVHDWVRHDDAVR